MSSTPLVTVQDGGGAQQPTSAACTATPGNTITITLVSTAGVSSWSLSCVYCDETTTPATINAGLSINGTTKVATFTAPAQGKAMIFQSQVNGGLTNGAVDATQTYTFKVYTATTGGMQVLASNEATEGSSLYGWVVSPNQILRSAPLVSTLLADFTSTTSASAQSTNLTCNVPATGVYLVEFAGNWSVASGTSGAKLALALPTGATVRGSAQGALATAAGYSSSVITAAATLTSAFNTVAATEQPYFGSVRVKCDGTHSGAITFQVAPVGAVVLTVKAGAFMRVTPVTEV